MRTIPAPFALARVDWDNVQEMALLLEETVASAVIQYGPNASIHGAAATGLANDGTAYTATVVSNDGTSNVSVVGSAAQTFATLITEINADLATADCTAALVGNTIVITKDTDVGAGTYVNVTDTGANPLFASVKQSGSAGFGLESIKSTKGNDRFLRWDMMDSVLQSHVGSVIDAFLAGGVANTNTKWQPGTDAVGFSVGSPTAFTTTGLVRSTTYQLNVEVDGDATLGNTSDGELFIDLDIPQLGSTAISFNHLLQAINNALLEQGFGATASFDTGVAMLTLRITSDSVGTTSNVTITDGASNGLLAALAAFTPISVETSGYQEVDFTVSKAGGDATGLANDATVYTASVVVDGGASQPIAVTGSAAQTYTTLLAELNADTTGAVWSIEGGNLRCTSSSTGSGSTVAITTGTVFTTLTNYSAVLTAVAGTGAAAAAGVDGTTDVSFPKTIDTVAYANWLAVLGASQVGGRTSGQYMYGPTGYGPLFTSGSSMVFEREDKPAAKGEAIGPQFTYFDNTGTERYFDTDVAV